jgi:hypothetical protein
MAPNFPTVFFPSLRNETQFKSTTTKHFLAEIPIAAVSLPRGKAKT